ncbi:MAG: hypothetical protein BWY64_03109 [bacterium ADurb.Bin363]|nr:MAG: hypothetical protein BWY64_03109 [bacterium ADurb.Bin363]
MFYKKSIILFILFFIMTSIVTAQESNNVSSYIKLLERVKNLDETVDFKEFRLAYTETPEYNPYFVNDGNSDLMNSALDNKQYEDAIKYAQTVLDKNYTDMDAHVVCKIAYKESGQQVESDFHDFVFKGLLKSILDSGDGKTPETAYQVISIREEYIILTVFGLTYDVQNLIDVKGHSYDMFNLKGEQKEIYFNIDILDKWLKTQLK